MTIKYVPMKLFPHLLFLMFLSTIRLDAQGICDSTISIDPILPVCSGTGDTYLTVSHPGGVFSGPGITPNTAHLDAEYLDGGLYTATYTIIGPGGCTVQATRDFEVRFATEVYPSISGKIDCANPNSQVTVSVSSFGGFYPGSWEGPVYSNFSANGNTFITDFAGLYKYRAQPIMNPNQCPAFGFANVKFENNLIQIKIEDCTDCDNDWPQKIRIASVPPNWKTSVTNPSGKGYYSPSDSTGCFAAVNESGIWKVQAINPENGCKSTTSQYLDTDHPKPSVAAGSNISIWCNGAGSFLAAMNPASGSLFNYFWTRPDGSTAPASYGGLLQATIPGAYVLHGVNTFSGCEDTDTAFAIVSPLPVSSQIAIICAGDSLLGHTQSGTYFDTIFQANGCLKTQITKLFVLSPLLDEITVEPDNGQMTGSINYVVTQGWPPFIYQWSSGETTASISNLSAGSYTLTVTDANQCTQVRDILVPAGKLPRKAVSDRESPALPHTKLYPNPAASGLVEYTLDIRASQAGEAILMLNDVLGRCLSIQTIQLLKGENSLAFTKILPEGVYALFLKGDFGIKELPKLVVTAD